MSYLVTDNCVRCKQMDCVEVCPVDCFYEGENFLVINPDECIDCGVCESECPVGAIVQDDTLESAEMDKWTEINTTYAYKWPNITTKRKEDVPSDWEQWKDVPNKFETEFLDFPGKGD